MTALAATPVVRSKSTVDLLRELAGQPVIGVDALDARRGGVRVRLDDVPRLGLQVGRQVEQILLKLGEAVKDEAHGVSSVTIATVSMPAPSVSSTSITSAVCTAAAWSVQTRRVCEVMPG